jgi:hypothetical protein
MASPRCAAWTVPASSWSLIWLIFKEARNLSKVPALLIVERTQTERSSE